MSKSQRNPKNNSDSTLLSTTSKKSETAVTTNDVQKENDSISRNSIKALNKKNRRALQKKMRKAKTSNEEVLNQKKDALQYIYFNHQDDWLQQAQNYRSYQSYNSLDSQYIVSSDFSRPDDQMPELIIDGEEKLQQLGEFLSNDTLNDFFLKKVEESQKAQKEEAEKKENSGRKTRTINRRSRDGQDYNLSGSHRLLRYLSLALAASDVFGMSNFASKTQSQPTAAGPRRKSNNAPSLQLVSVSGNPNVGHPTSHGLNPRLHLASMPMPVFRSRRDRETLANQPTTIGPERLSNNYPSLMTYSEIVDLGIDDFGFPPTRAPTRAPTKTPTATPTAQPTTAQPTTATPSSQPSSQPSSRPSIQPNAQPSTQPTVQPSSQPSKQPASAPTGLPSSQPSSKPSAQPSAQPSTEPSGQPTSHPSSKSTSQPSSQPSNRPSTQPSRQPSTQPTSNPTGQPSGRPSEQPSQQPSTQPTSSPVALPTSQPSGQPSSLPSSQPSAVPTQAPTNSPTTQPSTQPSLQPTSAPTTQPSTQPSGQPSAQPNSQPSQSPSAQPSNKPSAQPSGQPSKHPTRRPTAQPSKQPSSQPSGQPTGQPSEQPTTQPTSRPSNRPTSQPSVQPSGQPSKQPTTNPSGQPSSRPSGQPSNSPTTQPSGQPSGSPSRQPSTQPTVQPSNQPSNSPTTQPSIQPSSQPTRQPNSRPSSQPSGQPASTPTTQPSNQPSAQPSLQPTHKPTEVTPSPTSMPSGHPSRQPTNQPTRQPSGQPNSYPTTQPTIQPSSTPTRQPTGQPSQQPSNQPSIQPSDQPSSQPSGQPSKQPTTAPSMQPTGQPTSQPSRQPSGRPSNQPSAEPSVQPSARPSSQPTKQPSGQPTTQPSTTPSSEPSNQPSKQPSGQPSTQPSAQPLALPSGQPSTQPSTNPNSRPTGIPSGQPTGLPTSQPSVQPSGQPSNQPSTEPSGQPSARPSSQPTKQPTGKPSNQPSSNPSSKPSNQPSKQPSGQPSTQPSAQPLALPSGQPTGLPTSQPSVQPSGRPSSQPSTEPSGQPSARPSSQPSRQPTGKPSNQPSSNPSSKPSNQPSKQPSGQPSTQPSAQPLALPSGQPTGLPTSQPSVQPSGQPTTQPSTRPSSAPSNQPTSTPTTRPTSSPTKSSTDSADTSNIIYTVVGGGAGILLTALAAGGIYYCCYKNKKVGLEPEKIRAFTKKDYIGLDSGISGGVIENANFAEHLFNHHKKKFPPTDPKEIDLNYTDYRTYTGSVESLPPLFIQTTKYIEDYRTLFCRGVARYDDNVVYANSVNSDNREEVDFLFKQYRNEKLFHVESDYKGIDVKIVKDLSFAENLFNFYKEKFPPAEEEERDLQFSDYQNYKGNAESKPRLFANFEKYSKNYFDLFCQNKKIDGVNFDEEKFKILINSTTEKDVEDLLAIQSQERESFTTFTSSNSYYGLSPKSNKIQPAVSLNDIEKQKVVVEKEDSPITSSKESDIQDNFFTPLKIHPAPSIADLENQKSSADKVRNDTPDNIDSEVGYSLDEADQADSKKITITEHESDNGSFADFDPDNFSVGSSFANFDPDALSDEEDSQKGAQPKEAKKPERVLKFNNFHEYLSERFDNLSEEEQSQYNQAGDTEFSNYVNNYHTNFIGNSSISLEQYRSDLLFREEDAVILQLIKTNPELMGAEEDLYYKDCNDYLADQLSQRKFFLETQSSDMPLAQYAEDLRRHLGLSITQENFESALTSDDPASIRYVMQQFNTVSLVQIGETTIQDPEEDAVSVAESVAVSEMHDSDAEDSPNQKVVDLSDDEMSFNISEMDDSDAEKQSVTNQKSTTEIALQNTSLEMHDVSDEGSVLGGENENHDSDADDEKEDKPARAESPEEDLHQSTSKVKTYENFDEYLFQRSQDHSPNINKEGILKYNNFNEYLERRLKSDLLFSTAQKEMDGNNEDVPFKLYKDDYFKMFVKEALPEMRKEEYANLSASQDPKIILALIDLSPLLRDRGSDLCYLNFSKYLERQWKQKQYFDADQPPMDFKHYTEHCRQTIAPEMSEKEFKKEILSPDPENIRSLIERCPKFVTRKPASIDRKRRGSDSSQDSDVVKEASDISSNYSSGSDSSSDSDSDEEKDDVLAEMQTKANQVAAARKDQKRLSISMNAGAIPNTTMSPNVGFSNKSLSSTQDSPNSVVSLGRRASSAKLNPPKAFKLHSHDSSQNK